MLSLLFLTGCSNQAEIEKEIETLYQAVKAIPSSKPCENLKGYQDLIALESVHETNIYTQLSMSKAEEYAPLCKAKKENDALKERMLKVTDNMHIMGYVTGLSQGDYGCNDFFESEQNGFYCPLNKKNSDRIYLFSDPFTKIVGTINRYILIDKNKVWDFSERLYENYGEPNAKVFTSKYIDIKKTVEELLLDEMWGWGNVVQKENANGKWIGKDKESGTWLRFRIQECTNIWFTDLDCDGLFGIEKNPNKVIAILSLVGDEASINGEANRLQRDPRKEKEFEPVDTENVEEIIF
tara:strand:+ start:214 stop:1098 length:885 start_codon:yes stop_codon:yes gene_type:complete